MIPDVKQMYSYMKLKGYKHTKDVLGTYFDKDEEVKFTINKQANWYICYHNVKKNDVWALVNKSMAFDSFGVALHWVVKEVEQQKS